MAHELIEVSILIAALNREAAEAKRLIRQMSGNERSALILAILRLDDWIESVEMDEAETKLGTGKEDLHG